MPTIHANTQLKTGDTVNGLIGLKDCESGRCLNLRLDGKAVAPEGWPSVCQPPHARYFYVNLNLHEHNPSVPPYKSLRMDVSTKQEAVNLLKQFYAGYSDSNFGCAEEPITKSFVEALERYSVCHTQRQLCTPDRKSKVWCSGGVFARFCPRENAPDVCKDKTSWPKETCSELIYDAASGRFKPACAQHDPHLPESLKNERRCLSLCDTEGNCVIIRRTERGIELWQEKYKQRALLDPATGKVLGMEQDNGTAKLKLSSSVNVRDVLTNRISLISGSTLTVTANQKVTWSVSSTLLTVMETSETQLTLKVGSQNGPVTVYARNECESKDIGFNVILGTPMEVTPDPWEGVPLVFSEKGLFQYHLCRFMKEYGITNKTEVAAFFANVDVETGGGKSMTESTVYKTFNAWKGLNQDVKDWVSQKGNNAEAEFLKLSEEERINILYDKRPGLGNMYPGDGYRFIGRGWVHLTGRDAYQSFSNFKRMPQIMEDPSLIAKNPVLASESAAWFWTHYKSKLAQAAREGRFDEVRRILNGGDNGKRDRWDRFNQYLNGKGALGC